MSELAGRRMLVVLAHPDDETTFGGTLARYARAGVRIALVCTTNGGGGLAPAGVEPGQLAKIRQDELRQAGRILGIERIEFLEDRDEREAHLTRHNYAEVVDRHRQWISGLIEEMSPDVVLTFGSDGLTGHRTHIMVGELTTEAVKQSSSRPKLFYIALAPRQVERMKRWFEDNPAILRSYAEEVNANPRLGSPTPVLYAVPDEDIAVSIDISEYLDIKREAYRCHQTQGGGGGILEVFGLEATECFVAGPTVNRGRQRKGERGNRGNEIAEFTKHSFFIP